MMRTTAFVAWQKVVGKLGTICLSLRSYTILKSLYNSGSFAFNCAFTFEDPFRKLIKASRFACRFEHP